MGYKMTNRLYLIKDGQILNIGFEFDLVVNKNYNRNEIPSKIIDDVYSYITDLNLIMGQDIFWLFHYILY